MMIMVVVCMTPYSALMPSVLFTVVATLVQFQLVRDIEGEQFSDAVDKVLKPRMQLTGGV
jgi:hypothetical protein